MPASMWVPLVLMIFGCTFYFYAVMLMRARAEVMRRERGGQWVRDLLIEGGKNP